jgi:hypothetical protein
MCISTGYHSLFSPIPGVESPSNNITAAKPSGTLNSGEKHHYAFMWDASNLYARSEVVQTQINSEHLSSALNLTISAVTISAQSDGSLPSNTKLDEFRIYDKVLSITELTLNDNNGIGIIPLSPKTYYVGFNSNYLKCSIFKQPRMVAIYT